MRNHPYLDKPLRSLGQVIEDLRGLRIEPIDSFDAEGFVVTFKDTVVSPLVSTYAEAESLALTAVVEIRSC